MFARRLAVGDALTVVVRRERGVVIAAVAGDIDVSTVSRLRECLFELAGDGQTLIVDLNRITFIDSSGLGVLVGAARRADQHGASLMVDQGGYPADPAGDDRQAGGHALDQHRSRLDTRRPHQRHQRQVNARNPDPVDQEYFAPTGNLLFMSGFKSFIMRGNLVQLAVAVVIGTQFSDLVSSPSGRLSIRCCRWLAASPTSGAWSSRSARRPSPMARS